MEDLTKGAFSLACPRQVKETRIERLRASQFMNGQMRGRGRGRRKSLENECVEFSTSQGPTSNKRNRQRVSFLLLFLLAKVTEVGGKRINKRQREQKKGNRKGQRKGSLCTGCLAFEAKLITLTTVTVVTTAVLVAILVLVAIAF